MAHDLIISLSNCVGITVSATVGKFISYIGNIGSFLAAVAALKTVRQMKLQREASYQPELVLSQVIFEGSNYGEDTFPMIWKSYSEGDLPIKKNGQMTVADEDLHIPLCNIGLGAAKNVSATWSLPNIDKLVITLNQLAQCEIATLSNNGWFSINYKSFSTVLASNPNSRESSIISCLEINSLLPPLRNPQLPICN